MGACTSRPKDLDHPQAQLPGEKPSPDHDLNEPLVAKVIVDEAEATTITAQENNNDDVNDNGTSNESQKVEEPLVDLSDPTEPITTKTDTDGGDESHNPVADLVAVVDADSNKSDGAQLSHNADDQTTVVTSDKEEVDEKQDGKTKAAALEKSEAEKSST
ncbi:hypothetical protein FRX31_022108 [Thalictrum thalictroides]|uniref:Uncharacterized protein n=1 Tax=Thalictrum thalictroides TaxID=46969 RepID=A0A7J6VVU6_THATH|nr:hypothetical protein FRX31_022108 [Thalictrum thalictroides]